MAEFAIVVRSDLKGFGLGSILMDKIIRYCRDRCTGELCGEVLDENRAMQALARKLGFVITPGSEEGIRYLSLNLS
jgi:acetyltransferase